VRVSLVNKLLKPRYRNRPATDGGGLLSRDVHRSVTELEPAGAGSARAELALPHRHQLPDQYRVPLLLQLWAGYSLNDIAAALGCNVATTKTRVHRARARFRQLYVV
jgi:DNA-directed RNA polymerase specialized sigma24 family protein